MFQSHATARESNSVGLVWWFIAREVLRSGKILLQLSRHKVEEEPPTAAGHIE